MRLGVIGLGEIAAKAYLPLLSTWEGVDLLACSRSSSTVERHLARYPFERGTTDLEELISWEPRAALVLTPYPSHYEIAKALLENGVDAYVEKPLTSTSAESAELTHLAGQHGRVLMVGFNRRYAPVHRRVKELWRDRQVRFCLLEKHRPSPVYPSLRENFTDDVIHQIDLMRYFCGEAQALSTHYRMEAGELVAAQSNVVLEGGGLGVIATSRAAGAWRERYEIHGDSTSVYVKAFNRARWMDEEGEQQIRAEQYGSWASHLMLRGFEGELDHFLRCVQERGRPESPPGDAVKSQELAEDLLRHAAPVGPE